MQRTKIEFADYSYNPIVGCSKISTGCKNCFAEAMVHRFPHITGHGDQSDTDDYNGWDGLAHFFHERLEEPFHLRPGKDRPHRILVCSMSDLFHESLSNEQIAAVFGVMAATPQHQYVVLTKRLKRALEWFEWIDMKWFAYNCVPVRQLNRWNNKIPWPLPNVIIGASVENQKMAEERIPLLLQIPARWRGVSVEPMLGPVDFFESGAFESDSIGGRESHTIRSFFRSELDIVICGAETGSKNRPFKDDWAIDLREQCKTTGTPFFFKKDGNGKPTLCGIEYHEWIGE